MTRKRKGTARKTRTPTELEALLDLERVARAYYEEDLLYVTLSKRARRRWDVKLANALEAVTLARSIAWFGENPKGLPSPCSTETPSNINTGEILPRSRAGRGGKR